MVQLKGYLRGHGEYVSGNKEELLKRAKDVQLLKKPLSDFLNTTPRKHIYVIFIPPRTPLLYSKIRIYNGKHFFLFLL